MGVTMFKEDPNWWDEAGFGSMLTKEYRALEQTEKFKLMYLKVMMESMGKTEEYIKNRLLDTKERQDKYMKLLFPEVDAEYGTAEGGGQRKPGEGAKGVWGGMKARVESYGKTALDVMANVAKATAGAFQKMEDALVDFVMTGTFKFRDFANSILREMVRIAIQQAIMAPFTGWFSSFFTKNAKGNVYAKNQIVPFATGGIVTKPTIFPFKDGIGLMAEQGAEAIMPLRRGPGGRLGVEASGGGTTNISVSVDASGSSVEGDNQQSQQLGEMLAAAIQSELVNQQMPGGLLS